MNALKISLLLAICIGSASLSAQTIDSSAMLKEARSWFSRDSFDRGVEILDKVISVYPNDDQLLLGRGYVRLMQHRFDDAQPDLMKAASMSAKPGDVYSSIGFFINENAKQKEILAAAPYFDAAMKASPDSCEGYLGKAIMFFYSSSFGEAVALFKKGAELCPGKASQVKKMYAEAVYRAGQKEEGTQMLNDYISQNPRDPDAVALKAEWYTDAKQFDKALIELNKLISADPNNGRWYSKRALVYKAMGQKEVACSDVIRAQKLGDETAFYTAGKDLCLNDVKTIAIKPGTKLHYSVDYYGTNYEFIATVTEFGKTKIAFDWNMTNTEKASGKVKIAQSAIENAMEMHNYFNNREDTLLATSSAMWLSRKAYTYVAAKKAVDLNFNFVESNYSFFKESDYTFIRGNFYEKAPAVFVANGNRPENTTEAFAVLADPENPLILEMDLGWRIWLTEVENN